MPESKRTICALSAPVTVFTDEFMAELVKKLPKETCAEVVRAAFLRSQDRLMAQTVRNRRSDAYKAVLMARGMAERLRPLPDDLAALLGEKDASEVPVEGMTVEPATVPVDEDLDFAANLDIPEFKQFSSVFSQYPYLEYRETKSYGNLLVLGYCSGRGRQSNKLYRRNCTLVTPEGRRMGFKEIGSAIGVLTDTGPDGTHYTIKAIPFADGVALKFWTNLVGEGDIQDQYRYMLCTMFENIVGEDPNVEYFTTEAAWEVRTHEYRMSRAAKKMKKALTADITPAPL